MDESVALTLYITHQLTVLKNAVDACIRTKRFQKAIQGVELIKGHVLIMTNEEKKIEVLQQLDLMVHEIYDEAFVAIDSWICEGHQDKAMEILYHLQEYANTSHFDGYLHYLQAINDYL